MRNIYSKIDQVLKWPIRPLRKRCFSYWYFRRLRRRRQRVNLDAKEMRASEP